MSDCSKAVSSNNSSSMLFINKTLTILKILTPCTQLFDNITMELSTSLLFNMEEAVATTQCLGEAVALTTMTPL
jgi:hypothetical protein